MSNTIKYYDAQQWLRETQPKRAKLPAMLVAIFVTLFVMRHYLEVMAMTQFLGTNTAMK